MGRIVHLGLGNFHRAHQAYYTHIAGGWTITGVTLHNRALRDALAAQGNAYWLGIRGPGGLNVARIAQHDRVILAAEDPAAVIAAIAAPGTAIVTLTVTEKGYHLGAADGGLDLSDPDVAGDLTGLGPATAMGLLVRGLAERARARAGPITVLSCDNISGNGAKLATAVQRFAGAAGLDLSALEVTFPDTMVDRITPATTDAIRAEIAAAAGQPAPAAVMTEAFSEWVIEDRFAGPRPAWDTAGVEIVADVAPFELRKLRLLNGAHSHLAYAGLLRGHGFVHQAIADPVLRDRVEALWDEAAATLPDAIRPGVPAYRRALIERFAVPEMRHALRQIAADGSLKLRERIVPAILDRGADGAASPALLGAVATWAAFLVRAAATGTAVNDPNAARLAGIVAENPSPQALARAICSELGLRDLSDDALTRLAQDIAAAQL